MSEELIERWRERVRLGILSIGREREGTFCECDLDAGSTPCHYCAEHDAILAGEQMHAEIERLRADLHHCHGLLETAVDAMSTNGIGGCGLTPAWLDEAIRVIGWDDVDKEAGGDT